MKVCGDVDEEVDVGSEPAGGGVAVGRVGRGGGSGSRRESRSVVVGGDCEDFLEARKVASGFHELVEEIVICCWVRKKGITG